MTCVCNTEKGTVDMNNKSFKEIWKQAPRISSNILWQIQNLEKSGNVT
jgi:hypothetical protein